METIKGILVDPYSKTITEVQVKRNKEGSALAGLKEHMGCDRVDVVAFEDESNDIWVDDEGLYNNDMYFHSEKFAPHHILPGKCVITSVDLNNGSTQGTDLDVETVKTNIKFLSRREAATLAEKLGI